MQGSLETKDPKKGENGRVTIPDELLDMKYLNETIAQWLRPLPPEYFAQPLVLSGPSGVGKNKVRFNVNR